MAKKFDLVLSQVLKKIKPSVEETTNLKRSLNEILLKIKNRIKKLNIDAEIFVGGSFAKNTMIKKEQYDIDVFIRFSDKYDKRISVLTKKLLPKNKISLIHGSRDYFRISVNSGFYIEIIPVIKVSNPLMAQNITDLSYSHVNYVNKKANKKILDEIRFAKAFCYANNCYGAESYIRGFSGYSLELLIIHFGSFINFIKAISKMKKDKMIIDMEKHYKNKQQIMMDLNSSKLESPIILIDPTYKKRNTLAALSYEKLEILKKECIKFLKNPSIKSFEQKKINIDKIKKNARKNKNEFILLKVKTSKQKGDIAGSKLLKFYNNLSLEIEKYFVIKKKGFNYDGRQQAKYFFVVKNKEEILIKGPSLNDEVNVLGFKKKHKKTYEKNKKIYATEKINFNVNNFIKNYKNKNKKKFSEMYIKNLEIIDN